MFFGDSAREARVLRRGQPNRTPIAPLGLAEAPSLREPRPQENEAHRRWIRVHRSAVPVLGRSVVPFLLVDMPQVEPDPRAMLLAHQSRTTTQRSQRFVVAGETGEHISQDKPPASMSRILLGERACLLAETCMVVMVPRLQQTLPRGPSFFGSTHASSSLSRSAERRRSQSDFQRGAIMRR